MEGFYPITLHETNIGQVQICHKGLYYQFLCRCRYDEDSICKLMIRHQGKTEKLGIMVPEKEEFILKKQIPIKNFGDEVPDFFVYSETDNRDDGIFVPISPEQPFEYLSCLENASLVHRDGGAGAWIPEGK